MRSVRGLRLTPLVWLFGLGACTSVLGIEDLHEGPRAGSSNGADAGMGATQSTGGDNTSHGGSANTGGSSNGTAGSATGAAGTSGSDAGGGNQPGGGSSSTAGSGGSGTAATGGTDNAAGAGLAGDGGAGGAAPANTTVHGKVVDRWGKPVANATVQVGTEQVSSDPNGAFSVNNVAKPYTASVLIGDVAWVYQDLTRADPTLEFWEGPADRSNNIDVSFVTPPTLGPNDVVSAAFGTTTGSYEEPNSGVDSFGVNTEWQGPTATQMGAHALLWTKNNIAPHLPLSYKAFVDQTFGVVNGVDATVAFKLSATAVTAKAITGTATADSLNGFGSRTNSVFVRYASGASIQIVDDSPTGDVFSYQVPTLTNTNITFAAWDGYYEGPLGMVHKDGLAPGDSTGTLKIPLPPKLVSPAGDAMVDDKTIFSFNPSADNGGAFVLVLNNLDSIGMQRLYLVTAQTKKITVPNVLDGAWVLTPGDQYEWWVETHGSAKTTDAMTGPTGFSDEFGEKFITPVPTHVGDSTYTYTVIRNFTAK